MTTQRGTRQPDRRNPIRTARPTRQRASGPGDRITSAQEVAGFFCDDCRHLRDSLQLEMVVAQYLLRFRDTLTPEGVAVGDAVTAGAIGELERQADPLAHAILRGIDHLATESIAKERSADAV